MMHHEEARAKFPILARWWDAAKSCGKIYSRTDISRSGMSATVLLWTVRDGRLAVAWPDSHTEPGGILSEECAKELGFSHKRRAFRLGGCGFDRAHDVVYRISVLFDGMNPNTLKNLPSIDELNSPE